MSKAILVIDIPKKYEEKLNKITVVHTCYEDGKTRTMLLNDKGKKIEDYDMCYLKPLPLKKTDFEEMMFSWNDCIDEILGEE